MFTVAGLMQRIRTDNPSYERVLTSSLHRLVALLSRAAPPFTALEVATEMKRVMRTEPGKLANRYALTRAYLLQEILGLTQALRGELVNFRTESMVNGMNGAIVHTLVWDSDTGSLADLAHLRVRELVTWPTPVAPVIAAQHIIDPEPLENYRVAGWHAGVGNAAFTPGITGQGNDTHSAMGPYSPGALNYAGAQPLVVTFDQVYQTSIDGGGNWVDIPDARYTVQRELVAVGRSVHITITKESLSRPRDRRSNVLVL